MPVHQISVRETNRNRKSVSRIKDKTKDTEREKASQSQPKASSYMTGLGPASWTSAISSAQDICSSAPLSKLEEEGYGEHTPVEALSGAQLHSTQMGKKQVKRRHRRKRNICPVCNCVKASCGLTDRCSHSCSAERGPTQGQEYPQHRSSCHPESDSSSSDRKSIRQVRRWSREKTKRSRRHSQERKDQRGGRGEVTELQTVGSDEGRENQAPVEQGKRLKNRRKASMKEEEHRIQLRSQRGERVLDGRGKAHSSSVPEEEHIRKNYDEHGSGEHDTPRKHSAGHNGKAQPCSDDELEVCRICHCEGDEEFPLIMPCHCTGSLRFVHQDCLHQWIKSSDTRCCELCKYNFVMETHLKPLRKWEKLHMTKGEKRKIFCSVMFHIIAVVCVVWSLYVLIDRAVEEIKQGKINGKPEWPFWTKLVVVGMGLTGGLIFMYIQCKVYLQLWRRLKAFNRIIFVQNCPEAVKNEKDFPTSQANGRHESIEVPATEPTLIQAPLTDRNSSHLDDIVDPV